MAALREVQSRFYAAVTSGVDDGLLDLLAESGEVARRRLAAYRRSIFGNLNSALLATYPVVASIVGEAFFREAARQYVAAHASGSGDLNEYGGDFAAFLAAYPHAGELPYLPDVARLEWRAQEVYYAADPGPVDLSALAATPLERYGELRFAVAPARARLDSPWPLADIWRVNQPGYAGDMAVDFNVAARLLVLRRAGRVHVEALDAGEAALFDALAAGQTLAEAAARGAAADPDCNPGGALQRFAADNLLLRANL